MKAVLLVAGRGKRFGARTKALPKCLIPLDRKGSTLLRRYLDNFRAAGVTDITVVVGHLGHLIRKECALHGRGLKLRFVANPEYRRGSLVSLHRASSAFRGGTLIMDGDVFFDARQLKKLLESGPGTAFLADKRSKSSGEEMMVMTRGGRPWHVAKKLVPGLGVLGEATGIFKLSAKDAPALRRILKGFYDRGVKDVEYEDAYCVLMKKTRVGVVPVGGFWSEMDFVGDRRKISAHLARKAQTRNL